MRAKDLDSSNAILEVARRVRLVIVVAAVIVCAALTGATSLRAQASREGSWTLLVDGVGARVDIDTSSVTRRPSGSVTAWLRWSYSADELTYELQLEEFDCQLLQGRVLARRAVATLRGRTVLGDFSASTAPADSSWQSFRAGSLGGEVVRAACGANGRR